MVSSKKSGIAVSAAGCIDLTNWRAFIIIENNLKPLQIHNSDDTRCSNINNKKDTNRETEEVVNLLLEYRQ